MKCSWPRKDLYATTCSFDPNAGNVSFTDKCTLLFFETPLTIFGVKHLKILNSKYLESVIANPR